MDTVVDKWKNAKVLELLLLETLLERACSLRCQPVRVMQLVAKEIFVIVVIEIIKKQYLALILHKFFIAE